MPVPIGRLKARGGAGGPSVGGAGISVPDDPSAPLTERLLVAMRGQLIRQGIGAEPMAVSERIPAFGSRHGQGQGAHAHSPR